MDNKEKLNVLLKEYDISAQEFLSDRQRYHQQTNFVYLYFTIIGTVAVVLSSNDKVIAVLEQLSLSEMAKELFYLSLLVLVAIIGFYLFYSTLDALCMIYLNLARRQALERRINALFRPEKMMVWDSEILPRYHSLSINEFNLWIKPPVLIGLWVFMFFAISNWLLCILCYFIVGAHFWYIFAVVSATVFSFAQWIWLHVKGKKSMEDFVFQKSGL